MLPSLFLAHGSPMLALETTEYTDFLSELAQSMKPKAIVVFTAHWEEEILSVTYTDDVYETIYDFYGFPPELYAIKYPAKGSKQLASKLVDRFQKHGIAVRKEEKRGLDHGTWTLLYRMYPDANIPVVQISVNPFLPPENQYRIGEALRGIGEDDILVIGSGVTVHNLRAVRRGENTTDDWAVQFDNWLVEKIQNKDLPALFRYKELAPYARLAVPREEHFVPLFMAMGSGEADARAKVIHNGYIWGSLSYLCLQF